MKPLIILENIRSAYNVGNIIRTADALGRDVILSGFSPHPDEKEQVKKTSLGAEETVNLQQFRNTREALDWVEEQGYMLVAAEKVEGSVSLSSFGAEGEESHDGLSGDPSSHAPQDDDAGGKGIAVVVGNEVEGVLPETLSRVEYVVHIPMQGVKESLNVGQAAAIVMWELSRSSIV